VNLLYIHFHDTGRYIQPYGHAVPTPRLQQLADEGVLFRQAFCSGPTCSPSRAALLTGQHPHVCGMLGLAHRGFHLKDPRRHLAHFLQRAGYETVLSGVQHETHHTPEALHQLGYTRLPNCDDSPSKTLYLAQGWNERPPAREALYDLFFDPQESHNRAGAPECTGVLNDLRSRLENWMRDTQDPLLAGFVPPPPGATFNDPDGQSATESVLSA